MKRVLVLLLSLLLLLTACGQGTDLMEGIQPRQVEMDAAISQSIPLTDFAVRLFQTTAQPGENTLLSPLSVLYALAMTTNGAGGETLTQLEAAMGLPIEELNRELFQLRRDAWDGLCLANGIWFKDRRGFTVKEDFLQNNADYYGAAIHKAPFNNKTRDEINAWVAAQTKDRIPNILDEIPADVALYLVNALTFDGKWKVPYEEHQVKDDVFTKEDGTRQTVPMLYGTEMAYLEDRLATGFVKPYENGFAFVALLPREGVSVEEYLATLTGRGLADLLAAVQNREVKTAMPKFTVEYDADLVASLQSMGVTDAFDEAAADFAGISDTPLCIGSILHKTYLSVDEGGTQAAAVTAIEEPTEALPGPEEVKSVILDRPFVYLVIETETDLPIFMGTVMDVKS